MSALQEIVKSVSKKNPSKKTPAFYNQERTACIRDLSTNENVDVREAIATNDHTPSMILKAMINEENEQRVLKAILLHPNLPVKSIIEFVSTNTNASMFDEDEDIIELVKQSVQ